VKTPRLVLGVLLMAAASCSESTGLGALSGDLSFSHSGATSGTFDASGSVLVPDPNAATWAAAARDDAAQSIAIAAHIARPSNTSDEIAIDFPQLTPGTVTVANGAGVTITFGRPQTGAAAWSCALASGSVVVTSLSSTRIRGTFSGSGGCVSATGSPAAFTVTNGSFDAPLVDVSAF
jgi:hypothetical protein